MTKLLTTTAIGLFLGLTPALAQTDTPANETQTPPAVEQPAMPSEATPEAAPLNPGEPAQPIPDSSAEAQSPSDAAPGDTAKQIPDTSAEDSSDAPQMSEEKPSGDDAMPDSSVSEAPKSLLPGDQEDLGSESASIDGPKFLSKQESSDLLASNLIGQPVMNANDERIGDVNDLLTDKDGKVIAVIIGAGGFLGLGEKEVAVSFENLQFTRDEEQNVQVIADMTSETLASAPDFESLAEQEVTVGSADDDMAGEEETY